ncbi:MAG TPA: energy transducer TonB [Alphaproteobacteria bacterium]|nr:energy transducer TonB [Alphaproteobacteria bacterium]
MNRLQKKCVIGTAGIHLLLLTILIFGPAFFNRQPKTDDTVLDVIPANLVDAALNSGVRDAQAPQPTPQPAVIPPSMLQPPPPLPAPAPRAVQPPAPAPMPSPSLLEAFKEYFSHTKPTSTVTPDMKRVERAEKSHDDNIKVDLTKRTTITHKSHPDNTANTKAISSELNSLKNSLSSGTHIDVPGNGAAAMANYATVVRSVYLRAFSANLTDGISGKNHVLVKVTIARDGTVISSSITSPSGDSALDDAVQHTLNQVTFIAPFPDGATEDQRSYPLNFDPQAARELQ